MVKDELEFPNDDGEVFNLGNPNWKYHCFATGTIVVNEIDIDLAALCIEENNKFHVIMRLKFPSGRKMKMSKEIEENNIGNWNYLLEDCEIIEISTAYSKDKTSKSLWKEMLNHPRMEFSFQQKEK